MHSPPSSEWKRLDWLYIDTVYFSMWAQSESDKCYSTVYRCMETSWIPPYMLLTFSWHQILLIATSQILPGRRGKQGGQAGFRPSPQHAELRRTFSTLQVLAISQLTTLWAMGCTWFVASEQCLLTLVGGYLCLHHWFDPACLRYHCLSWWISMVDQHCQSIQYRWGNSGIPVSW